MISINIIAVLQTLLFAIYMSRNSNNNHLNKLLGVVLLVIGVNLSGNFVLIFDEFPQIFNGYYFLAQSVGLFVAPIVYYYLSLLSGKQKFKFHPFYFLSILGVLYMLTIVFNYFSLTGTEQIVYFENLRNSDFPIQLKIFSWCYLLLQHAYFTLALIRVYRFNLAIKNIFSTKSRTRNEFALKFVLLIWVLDLGLLVFYILTPMYFVQLWVIPSKNMIAFSMILYFALEQNAIFNNVTYQNYLKDIELLNKGILEVETEKGIRILEGDQIIESIISKKLHLNSSLTVFDLANEMNVTSREISQAIKKNFNKTFSSLINDMRIEEAQKLLKNNPKNLTMEGVGLESGFNSRASFYRVFKAKIKMSPLEYMKKHC